MQANLRAASIFKLFPIFPSSQLPVIALLGRLRLRPAYKPDPKKYPPQGKRGCRGNRYGRASGLGNKQWEPHLFICEKPSRPPLKNRSDAPLPFPRTGNLPADFPAGAVRNRTDLNKKV